MEKPIVKLEGIVKRYGNLDVVNHIDLEVKQGEFLTLLGPSGCGKTTTLRMIAGFEEPTSGIVWINDENVNKVEPYHREINTVFQSYSLFPHMTIFDNVAFGLKMKKVKRAEIKERVMEVLRLVQLDHLKNRKPEQLSGGQKQRIAIARAIVNNPEVLLLDEPLGALDLKLRKQMQLELKHLQQSLGITFIYVTHDQEEALTMSDRVVVMNEGRIEQIDEPRHIYQKPNSLFVANFIGETNILDGRVVAGLQKQLQVQVGDNMLLIEDQDLVEGESVHVSVRPECISIVDEEEAKNTTNIFKVIVSELIYTGASTKIVTELSDGQRLVVQMNNGHQVEEGGTIYIKCEEEKCIIYKSETEEAIPS